MAVLTAASGLLLGAGAAHAATASGPEFSVTPGFGRTVPLRTGGDGTAFRPVDISYESFGYPLYGVKVAVNAASLKGIAELSLAQGCVYTTDHLHESCTLGNAAYGYGDFSVGVRAAVGAKAGASGSVVFKVTAANEVEQHVTGQPADAVPVAVGNGPDLAINNLGSSIAAPTGRTTVLPLQVTNLGSETAKGVVIFAHEQFDRATLTGNARNCIYGSDRGGQRSVSCTFPNAVVEPGQTFALSTPFAVSVPAGAHGDQLQYGAALTGDTWVGTPTGKPGTGPALSLVPVVAKRAAAVAAAPENVDIDPYNNLYYTNLNTGIISQLSAVGGTFSGTVGVAGRATVGVRNSGDTVYRTATQVGPGLKGTAGVFVVFPGSVKVTFVPKGCSLQNGGPQGAGASWDGTPQAYACVTGAVLAPGASAYFTFGIRPLKAISHEFAGVTTLGMQDPTANANASMAWFYLNATKARA